MKETLRFNPSKNPLLKEALDKRKKSAEDTRKETSNLFNDYVSLISDFHTNENLLACAIRFPNETLSVAISAAYNPELECIDVCIQSIDYYLRIPKWKGDAEIRSRKTDSQVHEPLKTEKLDKKDFRKYENLSCVIREQLQNKRTINQSTK